MDLSIEEKISELEKQFEDGDEDGFEEEFKNRKKNRKKKNKMQQHFSNKQEKNNGGSEELFEIESEHSIQDVLMTIEHNEVQFTNPQQPATTTIITTRTKDILENASKMALDPTISGHLNIPNSKISRKHHSSRKRTLLESTSTNSKPIKIACPYCTTNEIVDDLQLHIQEFHYRQRKRASCPICLNNIKSGGGASSSSSTTFVSKNNEKEEFTPKKLIIHISNVHSTNPNDALKNNQNQILGIDENGNHSTNTTTTTTTTTSSTLPKGINAHDLLKQAQVELQKMNDSLLLMNNNNNNNNNKGTTATPTISRSHSRSSRSNQENSEESGGGSFGGVGRLLKRTQHFARPLSGGIPRSTSGIFHGDIIDAFLSTGGLNHVVQNARLISTPTPSNEDDEDERMETEKQPKIRYERIGNPLQRLRTLQDMGVDVTAWQFVLFLDQCIPEPGRCCLCYNQISPKDPTAVLTCGHLFHGNCISQTESDPKCVVCNPTTENVNSRIGVSGRGHGIGNENVHSVMMQDHYDFHSESSSD